MINVSNNVKRACNSGGTIRYREFIRINDVDTSEELEVDIKGNFSANAYTDNTFFGTFNMKMLEFETENNINFKGQEFDYYKEVNGEAFKIDRFIVTEVKDSDTFENVVVTAYDYGLKFATKYKSDLDFSSGTITFRQYIEEICTKCNVILKNEHLIGENIIIEESPEGTDVQFGNAIAYGAGFQGTFATITPDNKLEFVLQNATEQEEGLELITEDNNYIATEDNVILKTNEVETIDDYIELDDKRDTRPITCVLVAIDEESVDFGVVVKDLSLVERYGENWLKIIGNPLIRSTEKCQEIAPLILENVKGFGYTAFESKYSFKPYFTLGDIVKIKKSDGSLAKTNILRITTEYDDITLQAPSIINASVEYDVITPDNKLKDALINIDKANGQIVLKADSNGRIVQAELNANASEGSEFNMNADNINFEGYNFNLTTNNIKIQSRNLLIDDNGNFTLNVGFYGSYEYSYFDLLLVVASVLSRISLDSYTTNVLDISNDGSLTITDLTYIKQIITQQGSHKDDKKYIGGSVKINSNNPKNCLSVYDNNNNPVVQIGVGGVNSMNITSQSLVCAGVNTSLGTSSPYVAIDGVNGNVYATGSVTQGSSCKIKKNFEKVKDVNDIIKNTDIYKYNLINEDNTHKKHYGFVIGDNYNYSKEITSENNDGVELYSMTSVCFQAIKQLTAKIEELEQEIETLKNNKK